MRSNNLCPKCRGRCFFHVADKVAFAGDKSQFSLAALADAANFAGLRVFGSEDNLRAMISRADKSNSASVKKAIKRGIKIFTPDEFMLEIRRVCDGNIPVFRNPPFLSLINGAGKIYTWGLDPEDEKILEKFIKSNGLQRGVMRKPTLLAAITRTLYLTSGNAKILRGMKVPVYDFSKIRRHLIS